MHRDGYNSVTDKITLRIAVPDDALAVGRVHVRAWQVGYRDLLPSDYLQNLKPEDRAARYDFANADPTMPKTLVALKSEEVAGFATLCPARDSDAKGYGELSALYVHPDHWHCGIGSNLLRCGIDLLAARQYQVAILWVLTANLNAKHFYESHGWAADEQHRRASVWNVTVDEQRYRYKLSTS